MLMCKHLQQTSDLIQTYPTLSLLIRWCTFWCTLARSETRAFSEADPEIEATSPAL
jgi:hypothetical protein